MNIPPEYNGRRPWLQETYNNAKKGAEFRGLLEDEQHRLTTATLAMAKAEVIGGLGTVTVLSIAVLIAENLKFIDERAHPIVLNPIAIVVIIMSVAFLVSRFASNRMAKVYRYKEIADGVRELAQNYQDLDGVKRTSEERRFLKSPFGVAMRALVRTECKLDAAESLNVAEPVWTAAMQGVSRARGELRTAMAELEVIWQTRSGVDAAVMLDAFAPQERAEAILAAAAPHITTLILASSDDIGAFDV